MEEKSIILREKLNATIQALRGDPQLRVMRGKALLDSGDKRMTFVENAPRGARSVEVGRTLHSRFVRRPDGLYTITVRVNGDTKYLTETLVSEIREVSKVIAEDRLAVKKSQKDSENEGTGKAEEEKGEDTGTA
jgi:hypothetical protein